MLLYLNPSTFVEKGLLDKGKKDDRTIEHIIINRGQRELEVRREWEE